jgi:hypothetical protein
MTSNYRKHWTSTRRQTLLVATVAAALLGALDIASPAFATPKGEYAVFADCPLATPELQGCLVARTEGGEITIGKKTVPIKATQTLQGGFTENEPGVEHFVGAADGKTLSKTPQIVPGGLLGVVAPSFLPKFVQELLNNSINKGLTGVTATTELAAPASSIGLNELSLLGEVGTALSLPVKIKLDNTFLGSKCYIGSDSSPLVLNLTTGTTSPPKPNGPIKGKLGTLAGRGEGGILVVGNNTLVDNSFGAPGANGCGGLLSLFVDPAVDAELGLPSTEGHNTAILNGTLEQTAAELAKGSE